MSADAPLRRGWTTGSCATAAAKAAATALLTGVFPDPVTITLPGGAQPSFALAEHAWAADRATAGIVKDAGDDPDVTHGALIRATVSRAPPGAGLLFRAGPGVGTVTRPGLAIPPGEPAINPVPRRMIAAALAEVAGPVPDLVVEIAIPDGERLAERTLNGRLGIVGGLSILGTTGIVVPYSCAAWIHAIHRGIDVARATGLTHLAAATGATSEKAVQSLYGLPDTALIDMGDFVGGTLKYLRTHPVERLTIAGGVAKMTKLAQGRLDLHSKRGSVDLAALAAVAEAAGGTPRLAEAIRAANTAAEAFDHAAAEHLALADLIASEAQRVAQAVAPETAVEVCVFDREGRRLGCSSHGGEPPRKRRT